MKHAKIINDGESQMVILPKEFCISGTEVSIRKFGDLVMLIPSDAEWETIQ